MTNTPALKPGDRVKVTQVYTATIEELEEDGRLTIINDADGTYEADVLDYIPTSSNPAYEISIELLPPEEKPLEVGERVTTEAGTLVIVVAMHDDEAWVRELDGKCFTVDISELRRPDGQPIKAIK